MGNARKTATGRRIPAHEKFAKEVKATGARIRGEIIINVDLRYILQLVNYSEAMLSKNSLL